MSVETEARLTIGWRVDADDIPDLEQRYWETNWDELCPFAMQASEMLHENICVEDLCEEENAMEGGEYIIGVPAPKRELPLKRFFVEAKKRADLARQVYEQVMRRPPDDDPYMISWTHVW